ncbi:hypothetical protein BDV29DRAFT_155403 [Aspergillus leporis]|uniref:Uncharacterized protein n=1 Tax=Aspergillus leporis TaxID=41062 RepID=A0A5N5X910_9EURO|nr:hypothetical protein BDV29DRAFT_155403 [Aspergillus leporis]
MPSSSIKILNSNSSTSSFSTSISILSSKKSRPQSRRSHHTLHHKSTLTNLTRWVSRKISRQRLSFATPYPYGHGVHHPSSSDVDDDDQLTESYAAYCRAFSEGRTGSYNADTATDMGYERDHEHFRDFDGSGPGGDYFSGPHPGKYERSVDADGDIRAGQCTFLRHAQSFREQQQQQDGGQGATMEGVRDVPDFEPIGHYGFSPLAAPPLSPPPRILTPAIYAETTRLEREKSEERRRGSSQKEKEGGGGFWAPLRALWLHLRRAR